MEGEINRREGDLVHKSILVCCSCVVTAYNNTYVNYPQKHFKIFY
jgi:hypothetical protein